MSEKIYEAEYVTPLPLATQGEKIDVLVRVKDNKRAHHFNLIFVEKQDWPDEKRMHLRKLYRGHASIEADITPYPVKLRFRIEAQDAGNSFKSDTTVTERNGLYITRYANNNTEIWRANTIYSNVLKPGVYRVQIENLNPAPEINFETLFVFERDNRKY